MQGELLLPKTTLLLSAAAASAATAAIFSSLMKLIVIEDPRFFCTEFVGLLPLHRGRRAFLSRLILSRRRLGNHHSTPARGSKHATARRGEAANGRLSHKLFALSIVGRRSALEGKPVRLFRVVRVVRRTQGNPYFSANSRIRKSGG